MNKANLSSAAQRAEITRIANHASAQLSACGNAIEKSMALIQDSVHKSGTIGESNKNLLEAKITNYQNLAKLCKTSAIWLLDQCNKISYDSSSERSLNDYLTTCRFLLDQLHSEKADARSVLEALRGVEDSEDGNEQENRRVC